MGVPVLLLKVALSCGRTEPEAPAPPSFSPPPPEAPGSRPLQRLNRAEYDATVRALLGTTQAPGTLFPADEIVADFDNVASALTTTSMHVELWEDAADGLLDEMLGLTLETTERYGVQAEGAGVDHLGDGALYEDDQYAIFEGSISTTLSLPADGRFEFTVR